MAHEIIDMVNREDRRASAPQQMRVLAEEFEDLCGRAGWSFREVARRLDIGDKTVRQWVICSRPMPPQVMPWLRRIVGTIESLGPPDDWRHGERREPRDANAI